MTPRAENKGGVQEPWLDDPDAPPSEAELAEIARLGGDLDEDEAALSEALRSAHDPKPLNPVRHEQILRRVVIAPRTKTVPRGVVLVIASSGFLAAAAAAVLFFGTMKRPAPTAAAQVEPPLAMAQSRSAEDLFDEPFPREGGESARAGRIASAREHDLRQNRFAAWGVR